MLPREVDYHEQVRGAQTAAQAPACSGRRAALCGVQALGLGFRVEGRRVVRGVCVLCGPLSVVYASGVRR